MDEQKPTLTVNQAADLFNRLDYARQYQGWKAYEGDRNYNKVLGYPEEIDITDYCARYKRQSVAGRIVDVPAIDTWANPPKISENDNVDTDFVRAWQALVKKQRVWSLLSRADKLSGIGRLGIILIGTRGDGTLETPIEPGTLESPGDILYLRPFSEAAVTVKTVDGKPDSERFGLPVIYSVQLDSGNTAETEVHYTRVIHLADGKLDNEVYGTPRLEGVWNDLLDMVKFVGGGAEATWLNMRPGIALGPPDGFKIDKSDTAKTEWLQEIKRYQHDPLRMMRTTFEPKPLGQGIVMDPEPPFAVTLSLIAGKTGIPQRKLVGSAQGELASAKEDTRQWASAIAARQQTYAEPEILRPFIDWLIWSGAIPTPGEGGYDVGMLKPDDSGEREWPSIVEQTDDERAATSQSRATAARSLVSPGGALPIDLNERREILGFPPVEISEPDEEAQIIGNQAAQIAANVRAGKATVESALWWMSETLEEFVSENGKGVKDVPS